MPIARVSTKGWVVIPAEFRRRYGLHAGDEVSIVDYGGVLAVVPAPRDPIRHARGLLAGKPSLTRALLKAREEERRRERKRSATLRP